MSEKKRAPLGGGNERMNTRQVWDGGKRTPERKPLDAIRQTVKGFRDYQEWLPVLESLEQDFRSWQKQEQGRPTT